MKKSFLTLAVALFGLVSFEIGGKFLTEGKMSLVSPAEAIVGRPLTPVSYAGVARRTVRRCAAGVYYC